MQLQWRVCREDLATNHYFYPITRSLDNHSAKDSQTDIIYVAKTTTRINIMYVENLSLMLPNKHQFWNQQIYSFYVFALYKSKHTTGVLTWKGRKVHSPFGGSSNYIVVPLSTIVEYLNLYYICICTLRFQVSKVNNFITVKEIFIYLKYFIIGDW